MAKNKIPAEYPKVMYHPDGSDPIDVRCAEEEKQLRAIGYCSWEEANKSLLEEQRKAAEEERKARELAERNKPEPPAVPEIDIEAERRKEQEAAKAAAILRGQEMSVRIFRSKADPLNRRLVAIHQRQMDLRRLIAVDLGAQKTPKELIEELLMLDSEESNVKQSLDEMHAQPTFEVRPNAV